MNIMPVPRFDNAPARELLLETGLRRQIRAELAEIGRIAQQSAFRDEMTRAILDWQTRFSHAMNTNRTPDGVILQQFMDVLQEKLVDPLLHSPLDELAVLGSDGRTYGWYSLHVFVSGLPRQYQTRSPLAPQDPARFTIEPHLVVRHLVQWLHKRQANIENADLRQTYEDLQTQGMIARIPSTDRANPQVHERIQRIQERQMQRQQQQAERRMHLQPFICDVQQDAEQRIEQQFAALQAEQERQYEQNQLRLAAIEQNNQEQIVALQQRARQLEEEARQLEERNAQLQACVQQIHTQIIEAQVDTRNLQQNIDEVRSALKKQKSGALKQLGAALALVGACAAGTWAFQSILSPGLKGALMPASGGMKIAISF